MSNITGKAKRYDGSAIDYVLIFDWKSGKCLSKRIPDAAGNWSYYYYRDLNCGITYVASGCEPITHGGYEFAATQRTPLGEILHYSFNGNVLDSSSSALNGIKTGSTSFATGRKAGTQCIDFTAGCVRTPSALPINGKQITVSFWASIRSSAVGVIAELSPNYFSSSPSKTTFLTVTENGVSFPVKGAGVNEWRTPLVLDTWQHFLFTVDATIGGAKDVTLYVDNVVANQVSSQALITDFINDILFIGARAGNSIFFDGKIQDFRVYNRVLDIDERTALFDE